MTINDQGRSSAAARLAELDAALDAYGADRTRWPAPVRHGLSGFIATNADAQRKLREAAVFDRLLDAAPTLSAEKLDALALRIGALAQRQPRAVHSGEGDLGRASLRQNFGRRESGWAAAALAASLVLGIFAGQSPVSEPASTLLIESAATDDGAGAQQLAQTDEADSLLDEDLL